MNNTERNLAAMVKDICAREGIACTAFSYDWIFLLEKNGLRRCIFGYKFALNSDTAGRICEDKSAAAELLAQGGVPAVPHELFFSPNNLHFIGEEGNGQRLNALLAQHGELVCKTNEGTGGSHVYRVKTAAELEKAAAAVFSASRTMAVCPFVAIEQEYRVILLDGEVQLMFAKRIPALTGDGKQTLRALLAAYLRDGGTLPEKLPESAAPDAILPEGARFPLHWKHNLGQGAGSEEVTDAARIQALTALAKRAAETVGIRFASVDIIQSTRGLQVLEINSGVMMEHYSRESTAQYETAKEIYRRAILRMFEM